MLKQLAKKRLHLPRLGSYVPAPGDPKIFWFNSERNDIVREVVRRVMDRHAEADDQVEYVLNDVAHHEVLRLESQRDDESRAKLDYWRGLIRRLGRMSAEGKQETLREVCERMVDLDEGLQEWRYRHVKMVERTIGTTRGTGGSTGSAYLKATLFEPLFPDLWAIRPRL